MNVRTGLLGTNTGQSRRFVPLLVIAFLFPLVLRAIVQYNVFDGRFAFWTLVISALGLLASPVYLGYRRAGVLRCSAIPMALLAGLSVASLLSGNDPWGAWWVLLALGIGIAGFLMGEGLHLGWTTLRRGVV